MLTEIHQLPLSCNNNKPILSTHKCFQGFKHWCGQNKIRAFQANFNVSQLRRSKYIICNTKKENPKKNPIKTSPSYLARNTNSLLLSSHLFKGLKTVLQYIFDASGIATPAILAKVTLFLLSYLFSSFMRDYLHPVSQSGTKNWNYLCMATGNLTAIIAIPLCMKLLSSHPGKINCFSFGVIDLQLLMEYHHSCPKVTLHEWHNST